MSSPSGLPVVLNPGWSFRLVTMMTFCTGSVLIMWLGEQITDKGIGNGISLIIFCGIVVGIPRGIIRSTELISAGDISIFLAICILVPMAAVVVFIVFVESAAPHPPFRTRNGRWGAECSAARIRTFRISPARRCHSAHAGSSLLLFPATIGQFSQKRLRETGL